MNVAELLNELKALKTAHDAKLLEGKLNTLNPDHWWTNVKYVTGYLGFDERQRILNLFYKKD